MPPHEVLGHPRFLAPSDDSADIPTVEGRSVR
jgi:hypothetical protein